MREKNENRNSLSRFKNITAFILAGILGILILLFQGIYIYRAGMNIITGIPELFGSRPLFSFAIIVFALVAILIFAFIYFFILKWLITQKRTFLFYLCLTALCSYFYYYLPVILPSTQPFFGQFCEGYSFMKCSIVCGMKGVDWSLYACVPKARSLRGFDIFKLILI